MMSGITIWGYKQTDIQGEKLSKQMNAYEVNTWEDLHV